ncbi:MAG: polymer-forming cytoskeletal protein [Verrucomicrobia bacterium]|nr:polymer-forming cytoskeletal protein [Verrucomicrobiota bacterium]
MSKIKSLKSKVLISLLLIAQASFAVDFVQTEVFVSSEGESLREEMWVSAQTVTIGGDASNDLFAVASTIELNGTFYGDTWGCGDSISTDGIFFNDLRLMSRTAHVSGILHGSLIAAGTTVKIERTANLYGDALCLGENVIVEGTIAGDVRIMAQRVTLGGQISGDVSITAQDIVVLPGTVVNGNLTYTAPNELVLSQAVTLNGDLKRTFAAVPPRQIFKPNLLGHFLFGIAALVTGLVFTSLFPRYAGGTFNALRTSRGFCLLAGFAGLVMLPMTSFLLLFTVIGLPLSILLLLFYLILLYLSKIVVALWIGAALLRRKELTKRTVAAPLMLGLLIIYALTGFVAISLIVNILIVIFGLGALLLALFKKPVLIIRPSDAVNTINKEG